MISFRGKLSLFTLCHFLHIVSFSVLCVIFSLPYSFLFLHTYHKLKAWKNKLLWDKCVKFKIWNSPWTWVNSLSICKEDYEIMHNLVLFIIRISWYFLWKRKKKSKRYGLLRLENSIIKNLTRKSTIRKIKLATEILIPDLK